MTKSELAKNYFTDGCNCAQAVLLAFREEIGLPVETLKSIALPLGAGLGRLRETCGAVTGGAVALGLLFPDRSKGEMYGLVQQLASEFREKNGSYNCGELLSGAGIVADRSAAPEARTPAYYRKRPCADLVADAASILEEMCRALGRLA